jgi:hypothetical protein
VAQKPFTEALPLCVCLSRVLSQAGPFTDPSIIIYCTLLCTVGSMRWGRVSSWGNGRGGRACKVGDAPKLLLNEGRTCVQHRRWPRQFLQNDHLPDHKF